ncbi:origin recognition complex subunit 1-like [Pectinophora gossypiella]|uniref:origin recognition complex subunit 1-like n=1 Tax=Pectinophora gossypiella TaxID=13191 RepID=UPI00214F5517|nr:origin recognition complex subunit 1-like [Pectinophora gossypiella]
MVHSWDEKFSVEDSERFFKIVLKNALKRKETKNIRSSSQRKPNLKKQSQVKQTEGKNFTKVIKDKKGTQNKDDTVSITEKYIIKSFAIKSFEQHSNKRQSFIESGEDNDDIILNEQNKQMHEDETSMIEKLKMSEKEEGKNRTKINTKKRKQTTTESSYESDGEKEEQTNENIRKQSKIKRQRGNNKGEIEETTKKNADNFIDLEEEKNEQRDKNIRKQNKVQIIKRQNSKGETDSDETDKEISEQTDKNNSGIAEMTDHGEEEEYLVKKRQENNER